MKDLSLSRAVRVAIALLASATLLAIALGDGGCTTDTVGSAPAPCPLPAAVQNDDYCAALATYDSRCGHCDDCTGKNLPNCARRGAAISVAQRAAVIACKNAMPCADEALHVGCVAEEMRKAVPTAAQVQAKDAYCAACGATHADVCSDFFRIGEGLGKNGAGYTLLLSGDTTATRAVSLCSSKCDAFEYGVCVALILCTESGGDYCVDSGFCAAQP